MVALTDSDIDRATSAWAGALDVESRVSALDMARTLKAGDGPAAGEPLLIDGHPAIRAMLEAYDAGWTTIVVAGPVQDGKTYGAVVVPTLHQIAHDRRGVLLAGPSRDVVDSMYTGKIRETMVRSGLDVHLPRDGGASRGGVPDEIPHPTGCKLFLRGSGGANESQQASFTVRTVVVTEADSIGIGTKHARRKGEQEGRRKLTLFARRCLAHAEDRRLVVESTVKADRLADSLILSMYADSTGGRLWHPCPCCAGYHPREWEHVVYDPTDAETARASARIACAGCGLLLTPQEATESAGRALVVHRGQSVVDGRVVGRLPRSSSWGIRWTSLDSPLKGKALDLLCLEHRDATHAARERGDTSLLRQFWRDHLTACYEGELAGEVIRSLSPATLAARSAASTYERGEVPWAGELVLARDVQEREVWWLILCMLGDKVALVDWGVEYLCHRHEQPTPAQRLNVFKVTRERGLRGAPLPDGTVVPLAADGIDAGGRGWLTEVDEHIRSTGWRTYAMRGDPRRVQERGQGAGRWRMPGIAEEFRRDDGRRLLLAEADVIKGDILAGLTAPPDSPIAILLPRGVPADDHLIRHLCAEERVDGASGTVWVARGRNDLLDDTVYGIALAKRAAASRLKPRRKRGEIITGD